MSVRRYTTDLEQAKGLTDEDISEDLGQARDALKRTLEADIKARGVTEHRHSTDVESAPPPRVCMRINTHRRTESARLIQQSFTLKVSHVPILIE